MHTTMGLCGKSGFPWTIRGLLMVVCVFALLLLAANMQSEFKLGQGMKFAIMGHPDDEFYMGPDAQLVRDVQKVRLLCVILTMDKDLETKTHVVNRTWAKRCDKHFFVLNTAQISDDFIRVDVPDGRKNIVYKVQAAFHYIYEYHKNDFDFVLKADDDTYVIVENLKYLLWHYKGSDPGYLGYHFKMFVPQGYMSGGAGYVMSNKALRMLVEDGYYGSLCELTAKTNDPEVSEDLETGRCLETVGVPVWSSLDKMGRETFHPDTIEKFLFGNIPIYLREYAVNTVRTGRNSSSRFAISYHYASPNTMLLLEHLLYDISVFGLGHQFKDVFKIGKVILN